MKNPYFVPELNRRDFLYGLTSSLGALAMTDLVAKDSSVLGGTKKPMHEPKAKNVIMLFMEGGPSQVDTFDPKAQAQCPAQDREPSVPAAWRPATSSMSAAPTVRVKSASRGST